MWWFRRWFSPEPALTTPSLAWAALEIARLEIGEGETGGINNQVKYTRKGSRGSWCASFIGWCFVEAAKETGTELPFDLSPGAKRLYRNVGRAGSFHRSPMLAKPGDLICWDRGKAGSWQGHVGIVESVEDSGVVWTIEGNVGRVPATVRRFCHDTSYERLVGFARLP